MKKLLGILVLGLLLSGCQSVGGKTYGGGKGNITHKDANRISIGWDESFFNVDFGRQIAANHCRKHGKYAFYFYDNHAGVDGAGLWFCSRTYLASSPVSGNDWGWNNYEKISLPITEEQKRIAEALELAEQEELENEEQVKITSIINKSKSICKDVGFEEGTDRFVDCSFKLYMQSVELAAKNNQTIVMQPQSSGSNTMTIYDPVRDNQRLIDQGMKMLSGRCTLGIDC